MRRVMRDTCGSRRQEKLAALASRQHGIVSLTQAEALGHSRSDVLRRVQAGHLRRVLPRVYRIEGAIPSLEQRAMAAVLWAAPDAVASHQTATALWGISPAGETLHVTVERKRTRPPQGVHVHTGAIARRDRGTLRGIPVSGVARTLLDVAVGTSDGGLLPLVERAILDRLTTAERLHDVVARHPGRRGSRRLGRVLGTAGASALERRVEGLLRDAGLPPHEREYAVGRFRLDFAWPPALVAVEADSRRWHSSAADFERDRAKHNFLVDRGWRVLRVTWRDLDDPATWLTSLAQWL